ncbi:sulfatase-like hydrolase/transferase [Niveispirillum sp.]|uniref:sulfatase family protein n=1 Tax=Niveispirillum sp. TaxID=1917217 RepID=UPI001B62B02A|nr:sulfatase-like hydrolase/transferase [Niveispirillum sp.]MBP7335577.1 sulfatase-like hydrolase/transferase [Niveispirillum sp.]
MREGLNRRQWLGGAAALAAAASLPAGAVGGASPNIIFIMADDLGYADIGCYGGRIVATPHIDAIAADGARLTQACANSCVCSPTRLALLTGRYQYRLPLGLEEPLVRAKVGLPADVATLPRLLSGAGYRTCLVGKWHLGEAPFPGPLDSGYQHFYGIKKGGADYFTHLAHGDPAGAEDGLFDGRQPAKDVGYLTDLLTDRAVAEIGQAAKARQPLFLSLHYTAPHWPWEGPEDEAVARSLKDIRHYDGGSLKTYAAMLASLDRGVGRVLAALRETGLAANSIVIFTSDNGGERFSDVWPLIGMKGELLEGGIRVPCLVSWPGHVAPGTVPRQVAITMDWVPTLLDAAGVTGGDWDGASLLAPLTGRAPPVARTLFWRHKQDDQVAVRHGDWKYLRIKGREGLFDLAADERERANRITAEPAIAADLKQRFARWNEGMLPYADATYSYDAGSQAMDRP